MPTRYDDLRSETERLSPEQRLLIKETYLAMEQNVMRSGLGIFVRLFSEFPQYKNIWPNFRAIPDSALMGSDVLRKHAALYMDGLKKIVAALDDENALVEAAGRIADSHRKNGIHKYHIENMVPELLGVLSTCLDGAMTREISEAWTTLYCMIGNIIEYHK